MSKENEEQVREARAPYAATAETTAGEGTIERLQVQFPPYFDRFLEERDRRVASELVRLEAAVEHNGTEIARLLREMYRRFTEVREEMYRRFTEVREEMEHRFAEAKKEREVLRAEMHAQFRWTIGLLFPLVAGMLAIIIRVFLVGMF